MKESQTDGACNKNAEMRSAHKAYVSKYEGKRLIDRLVVYMKNNIKMDAMVAGCACMLWNKLTSCRLCDSHLLKDIKGITNKQ
jgi:hypothetical protein